MTSGLGRELARAAELGPVLVVRSSTRLDGEGAWSGAFASFREVTPDVLDTAVRGCWASLFSPDSLARFDQQGIAPETADMAVLVQPQLEPVVGGWTRIADGSVEVAAIAGSPAALLAGWERGSRYVVAADGIVEVGQSSGPLDASSVGLVADLARLARDELGAGRLEWALNDGKIVILQVDPLDPAEGDGLAGTIPDALAAPSFRRLASVLVGRSGRLADRLLVPWAAAVPDSWHSTPVEGAPVDLFDEAKRRSQDLAETVARGAGLTTEQLIDGLDHGDALVAERLASVTIDGPVVARVLGALDRVGRHLAETGSLRTPDAIWSQTVEWVDHALTSSSPKPVARSVGDRWAHVIYGVTAIHGRAAPGTGASDGWAAGRARFISRFGEVASFRSGDVLVVNRPLPKLAPLLWDASALVCRSGSPAAHLCEVARSLRLPAVVSSDIPPSVDGIIAAVDGKAGTVHWWDPTGDRS